MIQIRSACFGGRHSENKEKWKLFLVLLDIPYFVHSQFDSHTQDLTI